MCVVKGARTVQRSTVRSTVLPTRKVFVANAHGTRKFFFFSFSHQSKNSSLSAVGRFSSVFDGSWSQVVPNTHSFQVFLSKCYSLWKRDSFHLFSDSAALTSSCVLLKCAETPSEDIPSEDTPSEDILGRLYKWKFAATQHTATWTTQQVWTRLPKRLSKQLSATKAFLSAAMWFAHILAVCCPYDGLCTMFWQPKVFLLLRIQLDRGWAAGWWRDSFKDF